MVSLVMEHGHTWREIHNPKFLFPEECLTIGVKALCEIALHYSKTEH